MSDDLYERESGHDTSQPWGAVDLYWIPLGAGAGAGARVVRVSGTLWNSNSVIAWVLASSGADIATVHPPSGGRAPGWDAGFVVAARDLKRAELRPSTARNG